MKTHALQRTPETSGAQPKARTRRSGPNLKKGVAMDGSKHFGAQKLSYREAFKEMAAQADAERLEWTEWDADSGGLA